ncbi:hypothetical protein [Methylomagnum ishizawai]|uniref:hypothetical protein n=1 Tax=Methylomagnum ishizawai TaxID=1760988 RepID=UPI001C32DA04|nr:hypothetical protein [Methylomagnum ishizawai]BBL74090.1 hypothetical protein MishRS11D_11880 [Methylomagnum ishizawai]
MNKCLKTLSGPAAALLAMICATPGLASQDERGGTENESHASGSDHHSGNRSDDSHGHADGKTALAATLGGTVQAGASGRAKLGQQTRATRFEAELRIPLPADALAIPDRATAETATLSLTLSRADGTAYAECDFDLTKTKRNKRSGLVNAEYKIQIGLRRGVLQERFGLCDIDLSTEGAQQGVPAVQAGDSATVTTDTNGAAFLQGTF